MDRSAPQRPYALMAFVVLASSLGNFFLSWGMRDVGPVLTLSPLPYILALWDPWVLTGVLLLIAWLISQLSLLSRTDMSYAMPVTASGYIITAVLGWLVLREKISGVHWLGILLVAGGVGLVAHTRPRTNGYRR